MTDSTTMKLHHAAPSPFARKVRMAAIELGLAERIELVATHVAPGKANPEYAAEVNPLRKIPALTLADGTTLVDSTLICLYLDELAEGAVLVPAEGERRWQVLNAHAVATGMTEAAVALRYETFLRPEERRWALWSDDLLDKIEGGLGWFEARAGDGSAEPPIDLGSVALACLLGYLGFRRPEHGWRDRFPRLVVAHEAMARRRSYRETSPEA